MTARQVKRKKVGLCFGFTTSVVAVLGFGGVISPASAWDATILGGDITTNEVYHFYALRSWPRPYYAYQTPITGTQGGTLIIGQRDTGGRQFSRAQSGANQESQFRNDDGTVTMPPGGFYINVKSTGACGGDGCGVFPFQSHFVWGV